MQYLGIIFTLAAGYFLKSTMMFKPERSTGKATHEKEEEEEPDPPRNFTKEQLIYFDGKPDKDGHDKPVYLSVNGIVFDMSSGRNFYGPDGPYASFAGHECGVALAKMSFDTAHLDDLAGCAKLNFGEKTELDNWIEKFQYYRNYPIVGRLVTALPDPNRELTIQDIAKANQETPDGYATTPIYIAAKGKVYDMSFGGVMFYGKGGGYSLFAGQDATRALAKMSLNAADVEDPHTEDLTEKEWKTLDDWVRKFEDTKKYPVVGKLIK